MGQKMGALWKIFNFCENDSGEIGLRPIFIKLYLLDCIALASTSEEQLGRAKTFCIKSWDVSKSFIPFRFIKSTESMLDCHHLC